jgi:hypothetical protein
MASVSCSALMRWSGSQTCSLHPLVSLGTVVVDVGAAVVGVGSGTVVLGSEASVAVGDTTVTVGSLGTVVVTSAGVVSTVLSVWAWAGMDSMTVAAMTPAKTLRFMGFLQNERYGTYDDE